MQEVRIMPPICPVPPPITKPAAGEVAQVQKEAALLPVFYNAAAVPLKISKAQYADITLENFEKAALEGKKINFTQELVNQVQEGRSEIKSKASSLSADKTREVYALRDKYYSMGQKMRLLEEISQFQNEFQIPNPKDCKTLNVLHGKLLAEAKTRAFLNSKLYKDLSEAAGNGQIADVINKAQGHRIGKGGKCCVYEIPNTDYALRASNGIKINISPNAVFKYEHNFSPKAQANHVLASIEDGSASYEILERLKGVKRNLKNAQHPNYAKIIANMPQSAYDDYLAQIKSAADAGLVQDFGGENLFIDVEGGRFLPFDYETAWMNETTRFTKPDIMGEIRIEPVINMVYTFSLNLGEAEDADAAKIKGKILKAAAGNTKDPDKIFLDFEDKIYKDFTPKEILEAFRKIQYLKACGDWSGFQNALSAFYKQIDSLFINNTQDLDTKTLIALKKEVEDN